MFGRIWAFFIAAALTFSFMTTAWAIPDNHEELYERSLAYRTMYERFDIGIMRVYNVLKEDVFGQLDKNNEDFIARYVEDAVRAGKSESLAYAEAYAQCVLVMEALSAKALILASSETVAPQAGFYHLLSEERDGYLTIIGDEENGYEIEVGAWEKKAPESFAWVHAKASSLGERFFTDTVENPETGERDNDNHVQICVDFIDDKAKVSTTRRFRDKNFMYFNFGEDIIIKQIPIDGVYVLEK